MIKYKLWLIALLLSCVLARLSAQEITIPIAPIDTLRGDFERNLVLSHTNFTDITLEGYFFQTLEPLSLDIEFCGLSYRFGPTAKVPEKVKCFFQIWKRDVTSELVYERIVETLIDPMSNFCGLDSLSIPAGSYVLLFSVREYLELDSSGTTPAIDVDLGRLARFSDVTVPPNGRPDPTPVPIPFEPSLSFEYKINIGIKSFKTYPKQPSISTIPSPDGTLASALPTYYGQNTVSIFKSHQGDDSEGNLTINYCDDLGRLSETIQKRFTPHLKDLITLQEYDSWGRKNRSWLPALSGQNNGLYIPEDIYKIQARETNEGDNHPYTSFVYETSPLNKVIQQYAPGSVWHSQGKSVKTEECTNMVGNDKLDCFSFQFEEGTREVFSIKASKQYPDGSLLIMRIEDEDGKESFKFRDRSDKVILTRQISAGVEGNQSFDTYYIYDNLGQLRAVLPPALSEHITAGTVSHELLDKYAYVYKYDNAGNQSAKKLPGIGWSYYVYDINHKLIFSQDCEERKRNEWKFFISDVFARVCLQGVCKNQIDPFGNQFLNSSISCKFTEGIYDYLGYSLEQTGLTGFSLSSPIFHAVNYYDNYQFMYLNDFPSEAIFNYALEEGFHEPYVNPTGLLTGTLNMRLAEDAVSLSPNKAVPSYNCTAMYYNDRNRVIQKVSDNHLGTLEKDCFDYNFAGNIVKYLHKHANPKAFSMNELYTYEYDLAERLTKVTHRLDDHPEAVLLSNKYDELGRVRAKALHNGTLNTTYAYNIRNWLTKINSPLFSQNLHYTDGIGIPYFNGNISSMTWKSGNETSMCGYKFTYDELSRLGNAIYGEGDKLAVNPNRFNEQIIGYDKNGNILGLKRSGATSTSDYGLIDNLSMKYDGNQIKAIADNAVGSAYDNGFEFKDGASQEAEYFYDSNGNLTKDLNKKITDIQYNCLNLPSRIQFTDGSTISYMYAANGTKLRTTHIIKGITTVTDYCGNVIFENDSPKTLLTEAGYVSLNDNKYHYYLQDHQGNNRVVVDQNGVVEEVNHYYPLGGVLANTSSVQPYKYNGKELDRSNGLDWYDYGARHYDVAIGRWNVVDPMAEKYYGISPYAYCANNPVKYIDPDGRDWRIQTHYNNETRKIEYQMTVNAVLYNNSSNKNLDMNTLAASITEQINNVYTTSGNGFVSKMDFNMEVVNSVNEIGESDHVFRVVDQSELDDTYSGRANPGQVPADSYGFDVRISSDFTGDIISGNNTRTMGHELGHTGGLPDLPKVEEYMDRLMIQAVNAYGNPNKATRLPHSDIITIRDNYIHNRFKNSSPIKKWFGIKYISRQK